MVKEAVFPEDTTGAYDVVLANLFRRVKTNHFSIDVASIQAISML